jgi:hypothetical protein
VFVGRRLTREKIFAKLEGSGIDYEALTSEQTRSLTTETLVPTNEVARRHAHVVELLVSDDGARLSEDNRVEVFHDGREKFDRLIVDISAATDHVHVYDYSFRGDTLGTRIHRGPDRLERRCGAGGSGRLAGRVRRRAGRAAGRVAPQIAASGPDSSARRPSATAPPGRSRRVCPGWCHPCCEVVGVRP